MKILKGINATRIYKHNITQCTNMAVDGVVIKCSRIYNKHKYFVSVVEKVMNANVGKILFFFFFFLFFTEDMLWVLKQSRLKETFLLTTNTTHDTPSIHNFLFGRPSFSFQSYDTATSPLFCLKKDGGVCTNKF